MAATRRRAGALPLTTQGQGRVRGVDEVAVGHRWPWRPPAGVWLAPVLGAAGGRALGVQARPRPHHPRRNRRPPTPRGGDARREPAVPGRAQGRPRTRLGPVAEGRCCRDEGRDLEAWSTSCQPRREVSPARHRRRAVSGEDGRRSRRRSDPHDHPRLGEAYISGHYVFARADAAH